MIGVFPSRVHLPLFRRGQWYTSLDTTPVSGSGTLHLSVAPGILLRSDLRETRRILASRRAMPGNAERRRIIREALDRFVEGTLDIPSLGPQDPRAFEHAMLEEMGLPAPLIRQWSALLRASVGGLVAVNDVEPDPDSIWLVSLPANTFTCLEACAAAALVAGALWVRPSTREPLSALRFVAAMLAAGWPADRLALYGVDHSWLTQLVEAVDRAILYGGADVQRRFGGLTHVDVRGPGRAVAIVDEALDAVSAVNWLKHLVAANGGRFCTNVGTIVSLQPAEPLGLALAEELDAIVPANPEWPLAYAVVPSEIERVTRTLEASMVREDRRLTQRPIASFADGRPFFAPTVILVNQPAGHPLIGLEHPFPVAVIGTVRPEDCSRYTEGAGFIHRYFLT